MATDRTREAAAETPPVTPSEGGAPAAPKVRWDDSRMQNSYANVCNVASTREEVVLLFGINQAWQAGQSEIPIQLSTRVIISPHVAKRLSTLLGNVLREYEARFGPLGS